MIIAFLMIIVSFKKSEHSAQMDNGDFQKIDTYLQSIIDTANVSGLAIAITSGPEVVYSKGFGVTNIETKKKAETWI